MPPNPHVLIEMTDEADCRFVAAWLTKAAEAQAFWSEALKESDFAEQVMLLWVIGYPDLAAFALEIFGELEHRSLVAAPDLYADENGIFCIEFALLVQLGFFRRAEPAFSSPSSIRIHRTRRVTTTRNCFHLHLVSDATGDEVGESYHIAIPGTMSLAAVKQAALDVLSTARDEGDGIEVLQPERLLRTLSKREAERSRTRLIEMRHFARASAADRIRREAELINIGADTP
jgi:hypothetical protein